MLISLPAAADAVLVRVALSACVLDPRGDEPGGGCERLRCEPRDRLSVVARYRAGGWSALGDGARLLGVSRDVWLPTAEAEILAWREKLGAGPLVIAPLSSSPPRPSARCCDASAARDWSDSGATRVCATSGSVRASACTWTRRSSGASGRSASGSVGDGVGRSRRAGWQYLHVAVDDHSRLACGELLAGERARRLRRLPAPCRCLVRAQGITWERVLTDNAKAYHSHAWRDACARARASSAATRAPTRPGRTERPKR